MIFCKLVFRFVSGGIQRRILWKVSYAQEEKKMQVYRRVEHLFKNRISLNLSPTNRRLFIHRTFWPFQTFGREWRNSWIFFCRKAIVEEAQNCLVISIAREKNFKTKNFHSSQFFLSFKSIRPINFSTIFWSSFFTFHFPGLIIIPKKDY